MLQNCCQMISELPRCHGSERGGRHRCDDYPSIDIRQPRLREPIDDPGGQVSWRWNRNGEPCCDVDMVFHRDHAVLTDVTDRTRPQTLSISLTRTPCHFGGTRSWFACPGCSQRCAKLYFCNSSYGCRNCQNLAYRSQLEASAERPRLITQRIRRSLGGSANLTLPFPAKPQRMHWRTYYRIREKAKRYEARYIAQLAAGLEGWKRR